MAKIRVAILRGGPSNEYKTSMQSGASVLEHIDRKTFEPIDVIISKAGEWIIDGRVVLPEKILHSLDVVFNALHGTYGEDGTVQRLLSRYGIPYTGSGPFASRVSFNKALTKDFLDDLGIKFGKHTLVSKDSLKDTERVASNIRDLYGPEYVIKPVSSGSSIGTMMVKNPLLLAQALEDALQIYDEVLVEERIHGREATCGVIDRYRGEEVYALPPIEIVVPKETDFFDSVAKYSGETLEICPSRFNKKIKRELEEISKTVHKTLNLSQYSRSDFIVADDGIYFLEVNSLPGLTPESLFPKAIDAVGSSYASFISHLLTDAMYASTHSK